MRPLASTTAERREAVLLNLIAEAQHLYIADRQTGGRLPLLILIPSHLWLLLGFDGVQYLGLGRGVRVRVVPQFGRDRIGCSIDHMREAE